ncbi:MAG: hypothetical protein NVS4B8_25510 [Herpetosiphon sp.]
MRQKDFSPAGSRANQYLCHAFVLPSEAKGVIETTLTAIGISIASLRAVIQKRRTYKRAPRR